MRSLIAGFLIISAAQWAIITIMVVKWHSVSKLIPYYNYSVPLAEVEALCHKHSGYAYRYWLGENEVIFCIDGWHTHI